MMMKAIKDKKTISNVIVGKIILLFVATIDTICNKIKRFVTNTRGERLIFIPVPEVVIYPQNIKS